MSSKGFSASLRSKIRKFRPTMFSSAQGSFSSVTNPAPRPRTYETCTLCKSPFTLSNYHCQECQDARYCSCECLETDEDAHSFVCGTFPTPKRYLLPDERKYGLTLVRGLIFEANADRPKFVWVGVKRDEPVGLTDFLGSPPIEAKFHSLCQGEPKNTVRDRLIRDEVKVYTQGPIQGMQDNQSIRQVIGTCRRWLEAEARANIPKAEVQQHGEQPLNEEAIKCCCTSKEQQAETENTNGIEMHLWKGNIAFMILNKEKVGNVRHFRDADSTDFRDIVDFLSVCQGHQLANEDDTVSKARARKLRILNVYTQRTRECDFTELGRREHLVPKDHPLVRDQGIRSTWGRIIPISQCISLPMYAVKLNGYLRSDAMVRHKPDRHRSTWHTLLIRSLLDPRYSIPQSPNSIAAPGNNEVDLSAPISDELWGEGYGNLNHISVVLVRADQKDLRTDDIGRLSRWIRDILWPRLMERSPDTWNTRGNHPMYWTEETYAELEITKEDYHEFWHQREEEKFAELAGRKDSQKVKTRPCPYRLKK